MKKLVLLGASKYYIPTFRRLKNSGKFFIIGLDRQEDAPASAFSHEFYPIDIIDKEAVLAFCQAHNVDGIMPLNDFGVPTAAWVSESLGLPGISMLSAHAATDKSRMRVLWKQAGLPVPNFVIIEKDKGLNALRQAIKTIGYPAILKPAFSGGGARGVYILKTPIDLEMAWGFAFPHARNGLIILEQYIDGLELSVETISIQGQMYVLALGDKEILDPPTCITRSIYYPACLSEKELKNVSLIVSQALAALGLRDGVCHTEVRLDRTGTPYLLETGARGGGGHIFHPIIETVSGVSAPVAFGQLLTDSSTPSLISTVKKACCYRFLIPKQGKIFFNDKYKELKSRTDVLDLGLHCERGDNLSPPQSGLDRIGYILTVGETRNETQKSADHIEEILNFHYELG